MKIIDIVNDKTRYPDDAKFSIGGEEVTFGEFRRQNVESQGELARTMAERETKIIERENLTARAQSTLASVLERVSTATGLSYDQIVSGNIPANMRSTVASITGQTTTESGVALRDDPLYKPLFDSAIAPMQNEIGTLKTALSASIGAYKNDHTKLAYMDYLLTADKPEGFKPKYEDALQLAVNRGYKDEIGFPDVARALSDMAGPVSTKVDHERIRKEGYEEGIREAQRQQLAQLGQPNSGSGGIQFDSAPDTGAKTKTIKEKIDEAFKDPSIAAGLFGNMVQ